MYINQINKAYDKKFLNMKEYKKEKNFKNCLSSLSIENVIQAVERAKIIMGNNHKNGYTLHEYKGVKYYKENPSLMVWEPVEKILKDCDLL